jgi:hypothetical protein
MPFAITALLFSTLACRAAEYPELIQLRMQILEKICVEFPQE